VTTAIEHPSVLKLLEALQSPKEGGYTIVKIQPTRNGEIDPEEFISAIDDDTCLASVMLVNNENGYIAPVRRIFYTIKRKFPHVITHCDAVQGFLKIPFKTKELYADLVSISAHKVHAPRGIAALYAAKGVKLRPMMLGGGQESGVRSGTEAVALIAAFAAAAAELRPTISKRYKAAEKLRSYLLERFKDNVKIENNSRGECSPYIMNFSIKGIPAQVMLNYLEQHDIIISAGSACCRGSHDRVMEEIAGKESADFAIRVSTSHENTTYDMRVLASKIEDAIQEIHPVS
jgi:cysteine desulfurase